MHICLLRDMMGPSDANCGGEAKKKMISTDI